MSYIKHLALNTKDLLSHRQHIEHQEITLGCFKAHVREQILCAETVTVTHDGRIGTLKNRNGPLSR